MLSATVSPSLHAGDKTRLILEIVATDVISTLNGNADTNSCRREYAVAVL